MTAIPQNIKKLLKQRQEFRRLNKFKQADLIRQKIEKLGYVIEDYKDRTEIIPIDSVRAPKQSFLIIFGSGEITPAAVKIHDYAFRLMGKKKINIALVSTPAGFEPNVKLVYQEIADFFLKHFANYHLEIALVLANNSHEANDKKIIEPIELADFIFTGPGSPTYAVKELKNTRLYAKFKERISQGATLCLSSAAAMAFSRFTLPVYEIYKVGEPLHWQDGLNFYADVYKPMTVAPHFNNQDGGKKTDTSRCYMGKERFNKLLKMLPPQEAVYGLDENTAAIINLNNKRMITLGQGRMRRIVL